MASRIKAHCAHKKSAPTVSFPATADAQKEMRMQETLSTEPKCGQVRSTNSVVFTVDRTTAKIVSVAPVVDSDEELAELEPWIEACLILAALIKCPKQSQDRVAA